MDYKIVHYSIVVIVVILSIKKLLFNLRLKTSDLIIISILSVLSIISILFGTFQNVDTNPRMLFIPLIFFIIFHSKENRIVDFIFIIFFMELLAEYYKYYSGNNITIISNDDLGILTRFNLYRPWGIFQDLHLTSLFLVTYLFVISRAKLGWFIGLVMMSLQTAMITLVYLIARKQVLIVALGGAITFVALLAIGHFNISQHDSMINAYLAVFDVNLDFCIIIGCASNNIHLVERTMGLGYAEDNGILRILYMTGLPWLVLYTFFILKTTKFNPITIVFLLTIFHYPVGYGLLGTTLMSLLVNKYRYLDSFKFHLKGVNMKQLR